MATVTLSGIIGGSAYGLFSGNEHFYSQYAMPVVQKVMDGEQAHNFAIKMAKYGLVPFNKKLPNEEILVTLIFTLIFNFHIELIFQFQENRGF